MLLPLLIEAEYFFMFFPLFHFFKSKFMMLNEKEKTFLFRKLFGPNLLGLDDKTQRKILKGQHDFKGKVGRELFKGMEREGEFREHLQNEAEEMAALFEDEEQISLITLNNHVLDQFTKGFMLGAKGNGADEFLKAINHIKHLENQSIEAGKAFRQKDCQKLESIIQETQLPDEFWSGVTAEQLIENERLAFPLIFRGYLYTLAVVEAFILSGYDEITESQIVFGLLEKNNYLSGDLQPLQRFFSMVFYDQGNNKPRSINQIAEWIGERTKPENDCKH